MDYRIHAGDARVSLRLTTREYVTMQEVLACAHDMDRGIIQVSDEEIDRLARQFTIVGVSDAGGKSVTLSRSDMSKIGSIFLAATSVRNSPLRDRPEVLEMDSELLHILGTWPERTPDDSD